jgi:hypothetical protein
LQDLSQLALHHQVAVTFSIERKISLSGAIGSAALDGTRINGYTYFTIQYRPQTVEAEIKA